MDHANPILTRVAAGNRASWTSGDQPPPNARPLPPIIKKMILELGLRFRPTAGENQQEYAAAVTLLAQDVADVPPPLLDRAIMEWARTKRFLPRAAELLELARQIEREDQAANADGGLRRLQAHCDTLNALNGGRDGWHVVGHAPNRTIARANERRDAA